MRDDFLTRDWADAHQQMANGIDRLLSAIRALPTPTRPPAGAGDAATASALKRTSIRR